MRKEAGFEVTDRIKLFIEADDRLKQAISKFTDYIQKETLCLDLIFKSGQGSLSAEQEISGHPLYLTVAKLK